MADFRKQFISARLISARQAGARHGASLDGDSDRQEANPQQLDRIATNNLGIADEASKLVRNLFYFYLTTMLVTALVVGATTDRDILLNEGVKLPFYDAGIAISGFYAVAPALLFLFHFNLLVKLHLLRTQLRDLLQEVADAAGETFALKAPGPAQTMFRGKLYPFDYTMLVAGPPGRGVTKAMLFLIFLVTVFLAPLFILMMVQLRGLAFQNPGITLAHQAIVGLDAAALFMFVIGGFVLRGARLAAALATLPAFVLSAVAITVSALILHHERGAFALPPATIGPCAPFRRAAPDKTDANYQGAEGVAKYAKALEQFKEAQRDHDAAYTKARCAAVKRSPAWAAQADDGAQDAAFVEENPAKDGGPGPIDLAKALMAKVWGAVSAPWRWLKDQAAASARLNLSNQQLWSASGVDRATLLDVFPGDGSQTADPSGKASDETARRLVQPVTLSRRNFQNADFNSAELPDADFREAGLKGANFSGANMPRARFGVLFDEASDQRGVGADLREAIFEIARLDHAQMALVDASGANLSSATLSGANLRLATLTGANLFSATLTGANLGSATLTGAELRFATLTGADLSSATLTGADLRFATLTGANLSEATLTGADLDSATLTGADLGSATLTGADLDSATLTGADLVFSTLTGADLVFSTLTGADLRSAKLTGADLSCATLAGADLRSIRTSDHLVLTGADFSGIQRAAAKSVCGQKYTVAAAFDALEETCPQSLIDKGVLQRETNKDGANDCKAVKDIPGANIGAAVLADWQGPQSTVCAVREAPRYSLFDSLFGGRPAYGPPIGPDGAPLTGIPDCHDDKVRKAWYDAWRIEHFCRSGSDPDETLAGAEGALDKEKVCKTVAAAQK